MPRVPRTYRDMNTMESLAIQLLLVLGIVGGIAIPAAVSVKTFRRTRDDVEEKCRDFEFLVCSMKVAIQANDLLSAFAINDKIDNFLIAELKGRAVVNINNQLHATEIAYRDSVDRLLLNARIDAIDLINNANQVMRHGDIAIAVGMINTAVELLVHIRGIGGNIADLEKKITSRLEYIHSMQSYEEHQCRNELAALSTTPINDKNAALVRLKEIHDRAVKAGLIYNHLEKF